MSARDYLGKPGIKSGVWIDGSYINVGPKTWGIPRTLRQSAFEAMNLTMTVTAAYDGDGLPIVLDNFVFDFPFDLDSNFSDLTLTLETLTTAGGVHTLTFQKAMVYSYRLRAGQATFWMRGDASAQGFLFFDSPDLVASVSIPSSSVPSPTTVYKPSVLATDTPGAGEVWISEQMTAHPQSGKLMAFCKLGTAPAAVAAMTVASFPLFRVVVTAVPRQYTNPERETYTLMLAETN